MVGLFLLYLNRTQQLTLQMFALSQTTGYAIKALTCIAGGCEIKQIRDISQCTGVAAPYLSKVILRLGKAGILASKRGNNGGVWLARKPEEITICQISEAVDGGDQFNSCLLGLDSCSDERACPTHTFWKVARAKIRKHLEETTLADVLAFETKRADSGCCPSVLSPGMIEGKKTSLGHRQQP